MSENLLAARILALLEEHGSCRSEEAAAQLTEPPAAVRDALSRLRGLGLVEAVSVGEVEAHRPTATSHWRVTDLGGQNSRDFAPAICRAAPKVRWTFAAAADDRSKVLEPRGSASRGRKVHPLCGR